jgi:hypothetical protein
MFDVPVGAPAGMMIHPVLKRHSLFRIERRLGQSSRHLVSACFPPVAPQHRYPPLPYGRGSVGRTLQYFNVSTRQKSILAWRLLISCLGLIVKAVNVTVLRIRALLRHDHETKEST